MQQQRSALFGPILLRPQIQKGPALVGRRLTAALRDRYLEHVNGGAQLADVRGKYDVSRAPCVTEGRHPRGGRSLGDARVALLA